MVERPQLHERRHGLYGVFVFITDQNDNVLLFENKKTKEGTQKVKGQLTLPAETLETPSFIREIPRTIEEEVGAINNHSKPLFRGAVRMNLNNPILVAGYEIKTDRNSVLWRPRDRDEVGNAVWVPLDEINVQRMNIGHWEIPLFRSPIPELAQNVRAANNGIKFPAIREVNPTIPNALCDYLERNPRSKLSLSQTPIQSVALQTA